MTDVQKIKTSVGKYNRLADRLPNGPTLNGLISSKDFSHKLEG